MFVPHHVQHTRTHTSDETKNMWAENMASMVKLRSIFAFVRSTLVSFLWRVPLVNALAHTILLFKKPLSISFLLAPPLCICYLESGAFVQWTWMCECVSVFVRLFVLSACMCVCVYVCMRFARCVSVRPCVRLCECERIVGFNESLWNYDKGSNIGIAVKRLIYVLA